MSGFETIRLEADGAVARLVLSRPERMNALSVEMVAEIFQALDLVESGPARALLITGEGRAFCAGADLNASREETSGANRLERHFHPLAARLATLSVPTVAAVNGVAAGGGCSLALCCDVVLAAQSASFVLSFARIGLGPDMGASWILPRLIGNARARAVMMLAERVPAAQAQDWGMIFRSVEDHSLDAEAGKLAATLAAGPTGSYRSIRRLLDESATINFAESLERELQAQRVSLSSLDHKEGVAAFREKRSAAFRGE